GGEIEVLFAAIVPDARSLTADQGERSLWIISEDEAIVEFFSAVGVHGKRLKLIDYRRAGWDSKGICRGCDFAFWAGSAFALVADGRKIQHGVIHGQRVRRPPFSALTDASISMKKLIHFSVVLALFASSSAFAGAKGKNLFNGENFDGWVQRGGTAVYTIENG